MNSAASPVWRKSSFSSDPELAQCVEVADLGGRRGVRDSKNAAGPALSMSVASWRIFIDNVKRHA